MGTLWIQERSYFLKEFPKLVSCGDGCKVLEGGCGNGSTALSILRSNEKVIPYACDCSNETLERAKEFVAASNIAFGEHRFHPFYCHFATTGFPKWLACDYADKFLHSRIKIAFQIFTLSGVTLQTMPTAIRECFSVLKPGGILLFRDYGLYDNAADQRVGFMEYVRSDGTQSYFFCLDSVRNLFNCAGFIELEIEYCCVKSVNHRNGKSMRRVWVHDKFQKPV
ncbi:hypothetical protein CRYUN_Cryun05aG0029500 [Craigia yunnanensis]